tara:strand:+ start:13693 stop:13848 length:156 start_codon:yes stop_codon:yes gene_type:complete
LDTVYSHLINELPPASAEEIIRILFHELPPASAGGKKGSINILGFSQIICP